MYRSYSRATIDEVLRLCRTQMSSNEVARRLGIPRSTVYNWRKNGPPVRRRNLGKPFRTRPADAKAYSYLLGCYLGDGHICLAGPRAVDLRIYMDRSYPGVIAECTDAMRRTLPEARVRSFVRGDSVVIVRASSEGWRHLFPQHGPGKKHERVIRLETWQLEITHRYPRQLLRGLIHSDGSRCMNRFGVKLPSGVHRYAYPRYFFTNVSDDIRRIFCDHCERVGVHWTQSNWKNISVSHRDSVAILDSFIGPKT